VTLKDRLYHWAFIICWKFLSNDEIWHNFILTCTIQYCKTDFVVSLINHELAVINDQWVKPYQFLLFECVRHRWLEILQQLPSHGCLSTLYILLCWWFRHQYQIFQKEVFFEDKSSEELQAFGCHQGRFGLKIASLVPYNKIRDILKLTNNDFTWKVNLSTCFSMVNFYPTKKAFFQIWFIC